MTTEQIKGIEAFRKGIEDMRRKVAGIKGGNKKGIDKMDETQPS